MSESRGRRSEQRAAKSWRASAAKYEETGKEDELNTTPLCERWSDVDITRARLRNPPPLNGTTQPFSSKFKPQCSSVQPLVSIKRAKTRKERSQQAVQKFQRWGSNIWPDYSQASEDRLDQHNRDEERNLKKTSQLANWIGAFLTWAGHLTESPRRPVPRWALKWNGRRSSRSGPWYFNLSQIR